MINVYKKAGGEYYAQQGSDVYIWNPRGRLWHHLVNVRPAQIKRLKLVAKNVIFK